MLVCHLCVGYVCLAIKEHRYLLAIRLPDDIEQRLYALAIETGRTKTALARETILEYIDDLEGHEVYR